MDKMETCKLDYEIVSGSIYRSMNKYTLISNVGWESMYLLMGEAQKSYLKD